MYSNDFDRQPEIEINHWQSSEVNDQLLKRWSNLYEKGKRRCNLLERVRIESSLAWVDLVLDRLDCACPRPVVVSASRQTRIGFTVDRRLTGSESVGKYSIDLHGRFRRMVFRRAVFFCFDFFFWIQMNDAFSIFVSNLFLMLTNDPRFAPIGDRLVSWTKL